MISLNNIILSPHLLWEDEFTFSPVAQNVRRTIGGGLVTFTTPLSAGRPITLVAMADRGWITKTMVDDLSLVAAIASGVFPVSINGFTANVMFRHNDQPAFTARPILSKQVHSAGDYFTCTIKLITV